MDYLPVQQIVLPPTAPGSDLFVGNDIAMLVLSTPVSPYEAKIIAHQRTKPLENQDFTAVGYGVTCPTCDDVGQERRRIDEFKQVECVGAACESECVSDRDWRAEVGVCVGDSGGPALDPLGKVFGVATRGGPVCVSETYGSVDAWYDWIRQTVVDAASDAGIDEPEWVNYVPECGDGIIEPPEVCESTIFGDTFGGKTCATELGSGWAGLPTCTNHCMTIDWSSCYPAPTCGNGLLSLGRFVMVRTSADTVARIWDRVGRGTSSARTTARLWIHPGARTDRGEREGVGARAAREDQAGKIHTRSRRSHRFRLDRGARALFRLQVG